MRRLHLFEIEDQSWCPRAVRDAMTDYLRFAARAGDVYAPVVPKLGEALSAAGTRRVLDLCSGGGGPWLDLRSKLAAAGCPVEVVLTDYNPNVAAFERASAESDGAITFEREPVDVRRVPERLDGYRTLFAGFHHFRPEEAVKIIGDAVEKRRGIAVFEATERTPLAVAAMLVTPVMVLLVTPFIRPFRWSRLFWTYVVPAVPLCVLWDGVVSCLRTYTPDELRAFAAEFEGRGYEWDIGAAPIGRGPISVSYLVGYPRATAVAPGA
jgi:SAM-dependent methyltransferase